MFPAFRRLRHENLEFKARVGHILADDLIQQILDHTTAPSISKNKLSAEQNEDLI